MKNKKYFSLVELMIVVSILALVAGIVAKNVMGSKQKADIDLTGVKITNIEGALDLFKIAHNRYPSTEEGLQALISKPDDPDLKRYPDGGYLRKVPKDPWGNEFLYLSPGSNGAVDVWSKGPDESPGTEDDVTNWSHKE